MILIRIIALPFISIAILIAYLWIWIKHSFQFVKYGGEIVTYNKKTNKITIKQTHDKVCELIEVFNDIQKSDIDEV